MNSNSIIKILSGISVGRLADEATDTELLYRSDIFTSDGGGRHPVESGSFAPRKTSGLKTECITAEIPVA